MAGIGIVILLIGISLADSVNLVPSAVFIILGLMLLYMGARYENK